MKSKIILKTGEVITLNNVTNFFHDTRNNTDYISISTEKGNTTEYKLDDIAKFALAPNQINPHNKNYLIIYYHNLNEGKGL